MLKRFEGRLEAEELMDLPSTSRDDFTRALRDIRWSNRKLGGIDAVLLEVAAMLARHAKREARILDLGTGCADIPRAMAEWGRSHGIQLEITGVDLHAVSVEEARKLTAGYPEITILQGDALNLDAPDGSYDIVVSTQFMHHLGNDEAVRLLREKARLCRLGLVVNDLERHPLAWLGVQAVGLFTGKGRVFRHDTGPLSVLRGFSAEEMQALAMKAGLPGARIQRKKAYRLVLAWGKNMRPPERHGVVIGGGSLAGMAAAIRLHQLGIEALAIDKCRFPRKKLCGEFLGPDAFPLLEQLGVWERVRQHAGSPVKTTHFHGAHGRSLTVEMRWMSTRYPYGLAIPRETLDTLLVEYARSLGIPVLEGWRVAQAQDGSQGFEIRLQSPQETHDLEAAVFIDATGRNGGLIKTGPSGQANMVGIQCHVRLQRPARDNDLHMALFEGGYGGIQPLDGELANVCMLAPHAAANLIHADFPQFIAGTIGRNPSAMALLQNAEAAGPFSTTANLNLDYDPARTRLIRAGDALVTMDPFTGFGMTHALATGMMAAESVAWGLKRNLAYNHINRHYQRRYQSRFRHRLWLVKHFRPLMHSAVWQQACWPLMKPFLPLLARTLR